MKTVILASKLEAEINRVLGDFNDTRRNARHLNEFLHIGQEVRCGRTNGRWNPYMITKVGKRSFAVENNNGSKVDFIVTKYGQIYERGKTNERFGYHYSVDFDCEKIDARVARNEANKEKASAAIDLSRLIVSEINRLTPFTTTHSIPDDVVEKLNAIKAILGI